MRFKAPTAGFEVTAVQEMFLRVTAQSCLDIIGRLDLAYDEKTEQDAFRHETNARAFRDLVFEPDLVADLVANFDAAFRSDAVGDDARGHAAMVDVGAKPVSDRTATARARVAMLPATAALIRSGGAKKGDVLGVARIAGIMAAKRTSELIPLCHPLPLTSVAVHFDFEGDSILRIEATARVVGRTGVEMEALTAVSVAALTVYDMCKAVDRTMTIERIRLEEKSGGKSGAFRRDD